MKSHYAQPIGCRAVGGALEAHEHLVFVRGEATMRLL